MADTTADITLIATVLAKEKQTHPRSARQNGNQHTNNSNSSATLTNKHSPPIFRNVANLGTSAILIKDKAER